MQYVTIKNNFHNTEARMRVEVLSHMHGEVTIRPTKSQIKRARRSLCNSRECQCGEGYCGQRGPQRHRGARLIVDESAMYA